MVDRALAQSFETIGEEYDRHRPGFPVAAVEAILPAAVPTVLDLGAGTGKFTELLLERADRVVAVEPSAPMREVLRSKLPTVSALDGTAERIPLGDGAVDAVCVAQAFHWFDRDTAAAEIARVLRPAGVLGLLWNRADPTCAWDVACHRIAHPAVGDADATTATAVELPGFDFVGHNEIRWTERISRAGYVARWATVSSYLVANESGRRAMRDAIEAVLDDSPETAGRAAFDLPHLTDVFRYRRA